MAYGRYRRRRYSSRSRRALSNRNVYGKTSSKAQARQIATLRNRVNKVYRSCRPEVKVQYNPATSFNFDSQSLTNTYTSWLLPLPVLGTDDAERVGNIIHPLNVQFNLTFEYYNSSNTGYHNSESAGTTMRVIIGQYKSNSYSSAPTISGVLEETGASGSAYTNQAVVPLKTGHSEFSRVYSDRRFTLTSDRNQRIVRINVHPQNFRFSTSNNANYLWIMVISAGLHNDSNFSEFVKGTFSSKLAYTDA